MHEQLTNREHAILTERLVPQIDALTRGNFSEQQRFAFIGRIVDGILKDLRDPLCGYKPSVSPSRVPKHDDETIDRLARWQGVLAKADLPLPVQAEMIDKLERDSLFLQGEDRPNR